MSDNELRTALQRLAEPVPGASRPETRDAILDEVDRRRRRSWTRAGVAAAAVAGLALGTSLLLPSTEEPAPPETSQAASGWTQIADSPLSGRHGEVAVWTGTEMLVVGGSAASPCPPNADCAGPRAEERLADGAAYDPEADSWRPIADAPQTVTFAQAVWTGSEMVVVVPELASGLRADPGQPAATLAYNPEKNRWRTLDAPPAQGWHVLGAGTGEQPLFWASEEQSGTADWLLDPESGSWSQLPEDPLPATYDRSYTWDGEAMIFTALVSSGIEDERPNHFQMARLDLGTRQWGVVDETPVKFGEATWFYVDGMLVNPTQDWYYDGLEGSGGVYDLQTGEWREVPEPADIADDRAWCGLPRIGVGHQWIAGGYGALVSVNPDAAIYVPSCAPLHEPQVGVWAGDELIIYGGVDPTYKKHLTIGLRWTPPPVE
jgi:hypothetical protein